MPGPRHVAAALVILATIPAATARPACPFCGVVEPPLAQKRDAADGVVVATADGPAARDTAGLLVQPFEVVAPLSGALPADVVRPVARVPGAIEGTALLFGTQAGGGLRFEALAADEPLIAHVAEAPPTTKPAAERLRWFIPRLEHPEPAIAADAFAEFGLAPFAAVRDVANGFDAARLRAWLAGDATDPRRRGFYGLALGLVAARSSDLEERARCTGALAAALAAPGDDLRAGFDGIMAGLLVAEGERGLDRLSARGLLAADTRPGDARHVLAALRFAWESLADTIPRERTAAAAAALVTNPAVAAECTVDLARYGRFDEVDRVAGLWESLGRDDPLVRRAVAGYLMACPRNDARGHRERLAASDPDRWQAAVAAAALPR
jgi:hypothetical protein